MAILTSAAPPRDQVSFLCAVAFATVLSWKQTIDHGLVKHRTESQLRGFDRRLLQDIGADILTGEVDGFDESRVSTLGFAREMFGWTRFAK